MKSILNNHITAFCAVGIILTGHACAEFATPPSQSTPNSYEIAGTPSISFENVVSPFPNHLRANHYGPRGLGWSTTNRHKCTFSATVQRTGTAAGQPKSHNVSFEIWAQEFRGAEQAGYVKYAHDFNAQEGLRPRSVGYSGQTVVYFGRYYFPAFRLFEQGRDGVWRRADRVEFRTRQAM